MDDILLEDAKPDGFGRSAEPVAMQPQQQAAEAQHWAAMQQRMQVHSRRIAPCIPARDASWTRSWDTAAALLGLTTRIISACRANICSR